MSSSALEILILLNEEESSKEQLASALLQQCLARGFVAERIQPTNNLAQIVRTRGPKLLISDFLLGNEGTALDLLTALTDSLDEPTIEIIVWTDEPSLSVAIESLKLGAKDYILMGESDSLSSVLAAIEQVLSGKSGRLQAYPGVRRPDVLRLVGESYDFRRTLVEAESVAGYNPNSAVVLASTGSGRNSLARFIHQHRAFSTSYHEFDWDLLTCPLSNLFGGSSNREESPLLSHGASVFIDHVGPGVDELYLAFEAYLVGKQKSTTETIEMLIIGTDDRKLARAWGSRFDSPILEIPSLAERLDDLQLLLAHFLSGTAAEKLLPLSAGLSKRIGKLSWPGNIRELKAVSLEALNLPKNFIVQSAESNPDSSSEDKLSSADLELYRRIYSAKLRWERYFAHPCATTSKVEAEAALELMAGNQRLAAGYLGTSIQKLREALQ